MSTIEKTDSTVLETPTNNGGSDTIHNNNNNTINDNYNKDNNNNDNNNENNNNNNSDNENNNNNNNDHNNNNKNDDDHNNKIPTNNDEDNNNTNSISNSNNNDNNSTNDAGPIEIPTTTTPNTNTTTTTNNNNNNNNTTTFPATTNTKSLLDTPMRVLPGAETPSQSFMIDPRNNTNTNTKSQLTPQYSQWVSSGSTTPRLGHAGMPGCDDWALTPLGHFTSSLRDTNTPQQQQYANQYSNPYANTQEPYSQLERQPSLLSSASRYSHDPYSLGGSQRLSPQTQPVSHAASPHDLPLPILNLGNTTMGNIGNMGNIGESMTTPMLETLAPPTPPITTVMAAVPRERHDTRSRRRGGGGGGNNNNNNSSNHHHNNSRGTRALPDVSPPAMIRYLPPPPPSWENVLTGIVSAETLTRIAKRWYDRVLAAEASYSNRIEAFVIVPSYVPAISGQPSIVQTKQVALCPRMEAYAQIGLWSWLNDAERWWEAAIRPLTVRTSPSHPPYLE